MSISSKKHCQKLGHDVPDPWVSVMRLATEELESSVIPFVSSRVGGLQLLHLLVSEAFCEGVTRSTSDIRGGPPFIPIATGVFQRPITVGIFQKPLSALSSYAPNDFIAAGQSLETVHAPATTLIRINPSVLFRDRSSIDLEGHITTSYAFGLIGRVICDPGLSHHRNCCARGSHQGSDEQCSPHAQPLVADYI